MKRFFIFFMIFSFLVVSSLPAGLMPANKEREPSRNFVLFFEMVEYNNDTGNAIRYFFERVLRSGDQLIIYSPMRLYGFSPARLANPRELGEEMQRNLRDDISKAGSNYREIVNAMRNNIRNIERDFSSGDLRSELVSYRQNMEQMRLLRKVNEDFLVNLAKLFAGQTGKNQVIIFFQSEFRPIPSPDTLNRLKENPNYAFQATELFMEDTVRVDIDVDRISEIYLNGEIMLHFIYFHGRKIGSDNLKEHSLDVYSVFKKIADNTGGRVEVGTGPDATLRELAKSF